MSRSRQVRLADLTDAVVLERIEHFDSAATGRRPTFWDADEAAEMRDIYRAEWARRQPSPAERYAALPLCPTGCGCRVGSDDPDGSDCGCDGPCRTWRGEITPSAWEDDDA